MNIAVAWLALGASSFAGCALLGSFDGDFIAEEAMTSDGGEGGSASTTTAAGGSGGEGGDVPETCDLTCPSGQCINEVCVPWTETFGGVGAANVQHIETTADGRIIIAGEFDGAISFGDKTMTSNGDRDTFVAKLTRSGQVEWVRSFGGPWNDEPTGLGVDGDDAVYVSMRCTDTDFEPLGIRGTAGMEDICVAKLAADGMPIWAQSFGTEHWESPWGLAVSEDGVFVIGEFDASITLGTNVLSAATIGGFVMQMDRATGQVGWAKALESPTSVYVYAIAVAPSGSVVIAGEYYSSVNIGGINLNNDDTVADLFVAKLDGATGAATWGQRLFNVQQETGYAMIHDITNVGPGVVVVGSMDGSWDLGNGPVTTNGMQGFVARVGANAWHHHLVGTFFSELNGVASTPGGDVVVTGRYDGDHAMFGVHDLPSSHTTEPQSFMAHIGSTGVVEGVTEVSGAGYEELASPHIHTANNNLILGGSFDGTLTVGDSVTSAVAYDGFVMSYGAF